MYLKSNYSTNVTSRLTYVMDEPAHDGSGHRNLAITGHNIHMWGLHGKTYNHQSGYFLARQFASVRAKSKAGRMKRHQAQHMILSFADSEFPTDDAAKLPQEAQQVNQLVAGFMEQHFGDQLQWTSAVQCDGNGHKLHAHVLINSVNISGKTVPTNKFNVYVLRNQWNRYLEQHYQQQTGQTYNNPFEQAQSKDNNVQHGWQSELRETLLSTREHCSSVDEYIATLKKQGITVKERNRAGDWSYHLTVNGQKKKTIRDFYQRKDKKTGEVKSTRGIGKDFTPLSIKQYYQFKAKERDKHEQLNRRPAQPIVQSNRTGQQPNQQLNQLATQLHRQQHDELINELKRQQRDDDRTASQSVDQDGPDAGH